MQNSGPSRAFFKKKDLLLLAAFLALAGLLFLLFWPRLRPNTPVAAVLVGTGEQQRSLQIPLDQDGPVEIEGGKLPVHLYVEDGGIRFVHSECPDHLCENFGVLRNEGEWASCLPAEVFVRIP